jgi:hypothetical protein
MRIIINAGKVIYLLLFIIVFNGCVDKIEEDPCYRTKWHQPKVFEIRLAVQVSPSNPELPSSTPGSDNPAAFNRMVVSGSIKKTACSGEISGGNYIGNSYFLKGIDVPAPINATEAYWIGNVVYIYELSNDKDQFDINLTVKVTMNDDQSYMCTFSDTVYYPQIVQVPMELYHYLLLDIYSDKWVKV